MKKLGIIGAMTVEVETLKGQMTDLQVFNREEFVKSLLQVKQ